jgi:hypothetical protein
MVDRPVSIAKFRRAIARLPADPPIDTPGVWYRTQHEHWLGWLRDYHTAGAYGRQIDPSRDARYAYNHVVEPRMLLWLIDAAGVQPDLVEAAQVAAEQAPTLMGKSRVIRRIVPWAVLAMALWPRRSGPLSALAELLNRLRAH